MGTTIKNFLIYPRIWGKRLLKKLFYILTLFLLPLSVLFLKNCQTAEDAVLHVALYSPEQEGDGAASGLIQEMEMLSNTAVAFTQYHTPEALRGAVENGEADCGYLFPENLDQGLRDYTESRKPFLTAVRIQEDFRTKIVDEIVLSRFYRHLSYAILGNFLQKKTGEIPSGGWLLAQYQKYCSNELLFQFEYVNGGADAMLNDAQANYMLLPVRGTVSVIVLLCCMAGALLWYADADNPFFLMDRKKRRLAYLLSLLVPPVPAAFAGLAAIQIAGISEGFLTELLAMLLFLCCCLSLVHFLLTVFRKRAFFLAAIPAVTVGSFLFCPVFVDLAVIVPPFAVFSNLFPTSYYLAGLHGYRAFLPFVFYSGCLFFASFLYICLRKLWGYRKNIELMWPQSH